MNIDKMLEENVSYVRKDINGKYLRCFKPQTVGGNLKRIVIPIGKRKDSVSYTEDENSKFIKEIDYNIFDVNLMYYDEYKHACIMTCRKGAPTYQFIESYFNRFLDTANYKIVIKPMYYNKNLQMLRCAKKIKSIILTVDLGNDIASGFSKDYENQGILKSFLSLSKFTKDDLQGNKLKLELSLNKRSKDATMDINNVLNLIDCLNLESDFITEIEIKYANDELQSLDDAKLKNSSRKLEYEFNLENKLSVEELRERGDEAFLQTANKWYSIIQNYIPDNFVAVPAPGVLKKEEYKDEVFKEAATAAV